MHYPVEIALRDIPRSGALQGRIDEQVRALEALCANIRSCQVVAEALARGKHEGPQYAVHLVIALPGTEIVVNRESTEDVQTAVQDAFAAAGLQLKEYVRRTGKTEAGDPVRRGDTRS